MAKTIDEDGDGELSLVEMTSFIQQMSGTVRDSYEGPAVVVAMRRFVKDGRSSLSSQCKSDIRGLQAESKMLGDILNEAIAETPAGVNKEEFVSMMGDMTALLIDLFFKILPPIPDSAISSRLLPLRVNMLQVMIEVKDKLSTKHESITEAFFEMIDRDMSGSVTAQEFTGALKLMDPDASMESLVGVFLEVVDKDESSSLDTPELIEVCELSANIVAVAAKCILDAIAEAGHEGSIDGLLQELVSQYIGSGELTEADSITAFEHFTTDMGKMSTALA